MTSKEERIIILDALCNHFDRHKISSERLYEYLCENTKIDPNKINDHLSALEYDSSVMHITGIGFNDYQITQKW